MLNLSCGPSGPYTWVRDVQQAPRTPDTFVIIPGDGLAISVYNDASMSTEARVRSDGHITMQLVGDVVAAGKTPTGLARELETLLSKFLNAPRVAVTVAEEREVLVTVVGEVATPGLISLPRDAGVLQAIAAAGGLNEYADKDSIFVLRKNPRVRVRLRYDDLVENDAQSTDFLLLRGDVLYVE